MAKELDYHFEGTARLQPRPSPSQLPAARDEWEQLLQTLHETGALRTMNDFAARGDKVMEVVLDQLNSDSGRKLISAVLALGKVITELPPDGMERLTHGIRHGLDESRTSLEGDPPGTLALVRMLHEPETRRAIGGLLALLRGIGSHFHAPHKES